MHTGTLTYVCRVTNDRVLTHADVRNVTSKMTDRLISFANRLEPTNRHFEQSISQMHCGTDLGDNGTVMLYATTTSCLMSSVYIYNCVF